MIQRHKHHDWAHLAPICWSSLTSKHGKICNYEIDLIAEEPILY